MLNGHFSGDFGDPLSAVGPLDPELGTHVAQFLVYKCAKFVVQATYGWGAPIFQTQAPLP